MEIIRRNIILFVFLICAVGTSFAQDPFYRKNLANFRVDNLNQNQLSLFQQQISSSKMNDQEMVSYLASKGMSFEEINKLRARMGKGSVGSKNIPVMNQAETSESVQRLRDSLQIFKGDTNNKVEDESLIFGSDLFKNSKLAFVNDLQLATPTNYIIGPKDLLSLTLYGYQEVSADLKVLPDGKINIPYGGLMAIAGMTIEQASKKISQILEKSGYATLGTGETKLQLSVTQFRTFPVTVIGAKASGTYMVSSVANVFHALHMAGGPAKRGTYRDIELIRKGQIIQYVDLYSFMVDGNQLQFLNLQENDIINIPAYDKRVTLKGEIKTPGYFEMKEGENLNRLLKYSGGFTPVAYQERVYIEKVSINEFISRDIEKTGFDSYQPQNGDVVYIGSIMNRYSQRVSVGGAVMRPGYYGWEDSLTVRQLLMRAGGLKESSLLSRGLVFRSGHDHQVSYLRFNPGKVISGKEDLQLSDGDSVIVADKAALFPTEIITVSGQVKKPGVFIHGEKMTVLDALLLAGGLTESALPSKIEIARRVDGSNELVISKILEASTDRNLMLRADELELKPLDFIIVRRNPDYIPQKTVELTGQFRFPGTYILSKQREYLSELINRSGGFTNLADERYILIYRRQINPFYQKAKRKTEEMETLMEDGESGQAKSQKLIGLDLTNSTDSLMIDTISINFNSLRSKDREKSDIHLQEGDEVHMLEYQNTVTLQGEVLNKVIVNFSSNRFISYLRDAGGFNRYADERRVYVINADGSSRNTIRFLGLRFYPKVQPGSVVVVPSKISQNQQPRDASKLIALSSVMASTAGVLLAIVTLFR
jgi:protein involved in polysaccharide export with SLBB domain